MASSRPSAFKKGGGFLNDVDGVIIDYEFTPVFPGGKQKTRGDDEFHPLYCVLTVRVDGAEEDVTTTLYVGSADDFEIEDEGKTLVAVSETVQLRGDKPWSLFVTAMLAGGFDEDELQEDRVNYEAFIGKRVRFAQVPVIGRDGKVQKRVAKKGPYKGREFDQTTTTVTAYYGEAEKSSKSVKKAGVAKGTTSKTGKAVSKAPVEQSLEEEGAEVLLAILSDNDGEIMKSKLPVKLNTALGKNARKEALRKLIYSDSFLESEEGWSYDSGSKNQLITAS
jgi:hypothetical protein